MNFIPTNDDCTAIDRVSMRRYIHSVHRDDNDNRGFIVWAERKIEEHEGSLGPWKQYGYKWSDLLQHVRKIAVDGHKNMYLSLQTFCAPYRRAETLFKLNAIGFDIDIHDSEGSIYDSVEQTLWRLERDVFLDDVLPEPSMIIFTGRGLQVLYILETLPKQGVALWKMVGEAMAKRIRDCLNDYSDACITLGKLDDNYADVTRVLRIPGTYNTAASCYSKIVIPEADVEPVQYRLDNLRDRYLPELIPGNIREKTKKHVSRKIINLFNTYSLHVARLEDIVTLRNLRQAKEQSEDHRRRMVFLYRYWSCFYVGQEAALEAALEFNAGFSEVLPEKIVRMDTMSAEKAYAAWKEDNKHGYNYKNETLIKLLDITEEEQIYLKTIIGYDEKKRRRKLRNWDNIIRGEEREKLMYERDGEILQLLQKGFSYRSIELETGTSKTTVQKIAKQNNILRHERQRTDLKL